MRTDLSIGTVVKCPEPAIGTVVNPPKLAIGTDAAPDTTPLAKERVHATFYSAARSGARVTTEASSKPAALAALGPPLVVGQSERNPGKDQAQKGGQQPDGTNQEGQDDIVPHPMIEMGLDPALEGVDQIVINKKKGGAQGHVGGTEHGQSNGPDKQARCKNGKDALDNHRNRFSPFTPTYNEATNSP
jgi:hypothetical protein